MGRVEGKVVVVTGAGSGIGRASARALAEEGATLVLGDISEAAGEVAEAIGPSASFVRTDVRSSDQVEALVGSAIERHGRLDGIVNDVGVAIGGAAGEMSEEDWNAVIDVNLTGVWRGMRFAIPAMLATGGGSIVNLSSVQSLVGFLGWAGYAASKGGINALTQQAAVEYAPHGIRVNAILPGLINTPMGVDAAARAFGIDRDEYIRVRDETVPLKGGMGSAWDVANAALFLASDEARFITGVLLPVDGGQSARVG